MGTDRRLQIDMTPDGGFRQPARMPLSTRIIAVAALVAVVAGALAFAAFALWFALLLIPVVAFAALVVVGMVRYRLWQARRSFSRERDVRPL